MTPTAPLRVRVKSLAGQTTVVELPPGATVADLERRVGGSARLFFRGAELGPATAPLTEALGDGCLDADGACVVSAERRGGGLLLGWFAMSCGKMPVWWRERGAAWPLRCTPTCCDDQLPPDVNAQCPKQNTDRAADAPGRPVAQAARGAAARAAATRRQQRGAFLPAWHCCTAGPRPSITGGGAAAAGAAPRPAAARHAAAGVCVAAQPLAAG